MTTSHKRLEDIMSFSENPLLKDRFDSIYDYVKNSDLDFKSYQGISEFFDKHKSKYFVENDEGLMPRTKLNSDYQESAAESSKKILELLENKRTDTNHLSNELTDILSGKNGAHFWLNRCDILKDYITENPSNTDVLEYVSNYLTKNIDKVDIKTENDSLKISKMNNLNQYIKSLIPPEKPTTYVRDMTEEDINNPAIIGCGDDAYISQSSDSNTSIEKTTPKKVYHSRNTTTETSSSNPSRRTGTYVRDITPNDIDNNNSVKVISGTKTYTVRMDLHEPGPVARYGTIDSLFSGFKSFKAKIFKGYREKLNESIVNIKNCKYREDIETLYNKLSEKQREHYPNPEKFGILAINY